MYCNALLTFASVARGNWPTTERMPDGVLGAVPHSPEGKYGVTHRAHTRYAPIFGVCLFCRTLRRSTPLARCHVPKRGLKARQYAAERRPYGGKTALADKHYAHQVTPDRDPEIHRQRGATQ